MFVGAVEHLPQNTAQLAMSLPFARPPPSQSSIWAMANRQLQPTRQSMKASRLEEISNIWSNGWRLSELNDPLDGSSLATAQSPSKSTVKPLNYQDMLSDSDSDIQVPHSDSEGSSNNASTSSSGGPFAAGGSGGDSDPDWEFSSGLLYYEEK